MTQEQLAESSGFFKTTIYRYENGQASCTLEACSKIAASLNIEASFLYDEYLNFISEGFGNKIKKLRQKLGLTQKKFAALLNVGPKTISKWESAQSIPFRKNVEELLYLINQ
jgi:transcriptional regulator with XRE-family HTH domain